MSSLSPPPCSLREGSTWPSSSSSSSHIDPPSGSLLSLGGDFCTSTATNLSGWNPIFPNIYTITESRPQCSPGSRLRITRIIFIPRFSSLWSAQPKPWVWVVGVNFAVVWTVRRRGGGGRGVEDPPFILTLHWIVSHYSSAATTKKSWMCTWNRENRCECPLQTHKASKSGIYMNKNILIYFYSHFDFFFLFNQILKCWCIRLGSQLKHKRKKTASFSTL